MSHPEVFIIESLTLEDEEANRFEGQIISEILRLSGKDCRYYYVRTKREIMKVLDIFSKCKYRYLHISCHGNEQCLSTTLDEISFSAFGNLMRPYLKDRRLFVSACSAANEHFASCVMPCSGCFSILGPKEDILFSDAAILWASFYHVMFKSDSVAMRHAVISAKAQEVADLYRIPMVLVNHATSSLKPYTIRTIKPHKEKAIAPPRRPLSEDGSA